MKVGIFDNNVKKQFAISCGKLTVVLSAVTIFVDIPQDYRIKAGICYIIMLSIIYIIVWFVANIKTRVSIKIGLTTVVLKSGDIFKQKELKAIAFNEYFDTVVDDRIIAKASLNGQVITKYIKDIEWLDNSIQKDINLKKNILEKKGNRTEGKLTKYRLGSCIVIRDEFILTAFSKFNNNNEAELTMQEYVNFLLSFWNEINRLYAQRSVTVPVFGAGITRFKNGFEDIDINELLKIMIWTFKVSKIKFAYPAKLTIIIHDELMDKVNLYDIKESE